MSHILIVDCVYSERVALLLMRDFDTDRQAAKPRRITAVGKRSPARGKRSPWSGDLEESAAPCREVKRNGMALQLSSVIKAYTLPSNFSQTKSALLTVPMHKRIGNGCSGLRAAPLQQILNRSGCFLLCLYGANFFMSME